MKSVKIDNSEVSIDEIVKRSFTMKKIKAIRVCPDQDSQESANYCNNRDFFGNVCKYTTNYQKCPYYLQR